MSWKITNKYENKNHKFTKRLQIVVKYKNYAYIKVKLCYSTFQYASEIFTRKTVTHFLKTEQNRLEILKTNIKK